MKLRLPAILVFLLFAAVTQVLAADEFAIDPAHSSASFAVKHMLISTVHGRFTDISGSVFYDEKDPAKSSVQAVMKTASVNTDNAMRDKHLQSTEFFDTGKYPELRFQSTRVEKVGEQLQVTGNLTIKGVTRQITFPITLAKAEVHGGTRIGVEFSTTLNRFDYNVSYDSSGTTIGKEVKIDISIEAVKKEPARAEAR